MVISASLPQLKPLTKGVCAYVDEALRGEAYRLAQDGILDLVINGRSIGRVEMSEIEFYLGCLHIPTLDGGINAFPIHEIKRFAQNGSFAFGGTFNGQSLIVELR
jgi:hypothetical protein